MSELESITDSAQAQWDIESIIEAFDATTNVIPREAILAARERREEITPRLIQYLDDKRQLAETGKVRWNFGTIIAVLLLVEFRAKEALPHILRLYQLPDDKVDRLLGDDSIIFLPHVFSRLAGDDLAIFDQFVTDRGIDQFARWSALDALTQLVQENQLSYDDAVARMHGHLQHAIEANDQDLCTALVSELLDYGANKTYETCRLAFANNLVDDEVMGLQGFEDEVQRKATLPRDTLPTHDIINDDTIEELRRWPAFNRKLASSIDDIDEDLFYDDDELYFDGDDFGEEEELEPLPAPVGTIKNDAPRVGRNDPCPCNSGKKYKKCCGSRV
jgi:hypothetical protein